MKIHLSTQASIDAAIKQISDIDPNGEYEIQIKKLSSTRTALQNRAVHKYFEIIANELNAKDLTVQLVLEQAVERNWDMETVKSQLWKPIQKALFDEEKTSKADTKMYDKVYFYLSHFLTTKFGITTAFPSIENLNDTHIYNKNI